MQMLLMVEGQKVKPVADTRLTATGWQQIKVAWHRGQQQKPSFRPQILMMATTQASGEISDWVSCNRSDLDVIEVADLNEFARNPDHWLAQGQQLWALLENLREGEQTSMMVVAPEAGIQLLLGSYLAMPAHRWPSLKLSDASIWWIDTLAERVEPLVVLS